MRRLSLFGATGSVGQSTLDLIRRDGEAWQVAVLTANSDVAELARLAREFRPELAVIADETRHAELKDALAGTNIAVAAGAEALTEAATYPTDLVLAAIVGASPAVPTIAASTRSVGQVAASISAPAPAATPIFVPASASFSSS